LTRQFPPPTPNAGANAVEKKELQEGLSRNHQVHNWMVRKVHKVRRVHEVRRVPRAPKVPPRVPPKVQEIQRA
jgi:hypothetical protein